MNGTHVAEGVDCIGTIEAPVARNVLARVRIWYHYKKMEHESAWDIISRDAEEPSYIHLPLKDDSRTSVPTVAGRRQATVRAPKYSMHYVTATTPPSYLCTGLISRRLLRERINF
jgi:hypothetical protein